MNALLYVASLIFATQLTLGGRLRHQSADQPAFLLFGGGAKTPLVRVEPDGRYPGMWRMHWPSGEISDLANLTRIKDAAVVLCERGPPARNPQRLHWRTDRSESLNGGRGRARGGAGYPEAGPARSWGYRPPAVGPGKTTWSARAPATTALQPDELLTVKSVDGSVAIVGTNSGATAKADIETVSEAANWIDGFYSGRARRPNREAARDERRLSPSSSTPPRRGRGMAGRGARSRDAETDTQSPKI